MTPAGSQIVVLSSPIWRERVRRHAVQVRDWTRPYAQRRAENRPHPVHDFIFTYYRYSMRKLEAWHPGIEVALEDDGGSSPWSEQAAYRRIGGNWRLDPATLDPAEVSRLRRTRDLLRATAARPGNFACHGLHEWAMVYRTDRIRHETTPLRISPEEIASIVESRPIACSHFDAFRFFTPAARPLNRLQPTSDSRERHEQPGCVHANMDLYKWAYQSMPWIGSDLLWKTFLLALDLRELDMRASPYDLRPFGYLPIEIERAEGRLEYERLQRELAKRAATLRAELILALERVIDLSHSYPTS